MISTNILGALASMAWPERRKKSGIHFPYHICSVTIWHVGHTVIFDGQQ